jgi:hypothetical protein
VIRKAEKEIAEFRRFQALAQELIAINQKICRLRPVTKAEAFLVKKKGGSAAARNPPRSRGFLQRIFREQQNRVGLDLEAVEMAIRSRMHQAGAAVSSQLLEFSPPVRNGDNSAVPATTEPVM